MIALLKDFDSVPSSYLREDSSLKVHFQRSEYTWFPEMQSGKTTIYKKKTKFKKIAYISYEI